MGYTIYYKTKTYLTQEEVRAGANYLISNYNPKVLKLDSIGKPLPDGSTEVYVCLNVVNPNSHVETLAFHPNEKGEIDFEFCKTNRYPKEDKEIKRLLIGLQKIVGDKLDISCDDGYIYTSKGKRKKK